MVSGRKQVRPLSLSLTLLAHMVLGWEVVESGGGVPETGIRDRFFAVFGGFPTPFQEKKEMLNREIEQREQT